MSGRDLQEEPNSFMTIGFGEEAWVLTPRSPSGLREFDEFCVFIVKEVNSLKFLEPEVNLGHW
jgi:hypothetical protein